MSPDELHERGAPWPDDDHPHEEGISLAQIDGLLKILDAPGQRVLDLGCGSGRVLVPLAAAGHALTGVDRNAEALARCRTSLESANATAELIEASFFEDVPSTASTFDAVLCLGNTIMTVSDVDRAVEFLRAASVALTVDGVFVMDDCPRDFWPEVTEGNWLAGISDDGCAQMVWSESDAVFAFRRGDDVDTDSWEIGPHDRPLRLWSDGALRLAARAAGLSAPARLKDAHLLVMRKLPNPDP